METIKTYIETMFKGVADNNEIRDLKEEITSNMQERYKELKEQGKSENESIGAVISEFGNIDELLSEMGYSSEMSENDKEEKVPVASREEVLEYMKDSKKLGEKVGLGVAIILCSMVIISLINGGVHEFVLGARVDRSMLQGSVMMIGVIIAVGIFIYYGLKMEKYKAIESKKVQIDFATAKFIEEEFKVKKEKYNVQMVIGIALLMASVIPGIVISGFLGDTVLKEELGGAAMFFLVAIGVYILVRTGVEVDSYETVIELRDYHTARSQVKQIKKWVSRIHGIMWPIVSAVYLYLGFVHDLWDSAWIIFVLAGVISPVIGGVVKILLERKKK